MTEEVTHYIYALVDPRTSEVRYVGKSIDPKQRLREHISRVKCNKSANRYKDNWIRSVLNNDERPALRIIEEVRGEEWREAEKTWIQWGRAEGWPLTNLEEGGYGAGTLAEETKRKISESVKRWHEENINPFRGKMHSEETRQTLSEKAKERYKKDPLAHPSKQREYKPHSKGTKRKISKALKEKTPNKEYKRSPRPDHFHAGKDNPMYGKKLTEEQKKKVAEASLENWNNPEYRNKRKKSLNEAGPRGDIPYKGVSHHRNGRFRARIWDNENKKEISLGTHDTAEEAARAYDKKAIELFGNDCYTNFNSKGGG